MCVDHFCRFRGSKSTPPARSIMQYNTRTLLESRTEAGCVCEARVTCVEPQQRGSRVSTPGTPDMILREREAGSISTQCSVSSKRDKVLNEEDTRLTPAWIPHALLYIPRLKINTEAQNTVKSTPHVSFRTHFCRFRVDGPDRPRSLPQIGLSWLSNAAHDDEVLSACGGWR
jgi:hypothetical protein